MAGLQLTKVLAKAGLDGQSISSKSLLSFSLVGRKINRQQILSSAKQFQIIIGPGLTEYYFPSFANTRSLYANFKQHYMKHLSFFFILICSISFSSFGQYKISDGVNYSAPVQIDSSGFYIIGHLIEKSNKAKYNTEIGQLHSYSYQSSWTNVSIYNLETNQTKKLFSNSLTLVFPVYNGNYFPNNNDYGIVKNFMYSAVLKNYLLFSIKNDEYNKDEVIDEDDPVSLFISLKDGNGVTQISPKDMNVNSFKLSKDGNTLLINVQKDKNGDKKFANEDELIYQINLDQDISKIKAIQINL